MQTIFPLKPQYLRLGYVMQIVVFYAFHYHEISGPLKGSIQLVECLHREFAGDTLRSEVTFNESLWRPDDKESYQKIMQVRLAPFPTPEFWILELDFRRGMFSGVYLVSETGKCLCNVFDLKIRSRVRQGDNMANKSDRRRKAMAQKRSAKEQRTAEHGKGKSKYSLKHKQQARGHFFPTSPFYLPPEERARLEEELGI